MIYALKRIWQYLWNGVPQKNILRCEIIQSKSSQKLYGKHILITGGGRGLGYYIAKKSVQEGATVLIAGRNEETLKKASFEIGCNYIPFDITEISAIPHFMSQCISKLNGRIDCLVNNAGISLHEKNMMEVTEKTFDMQFATNLKAPYFISQSFLRHCEATENHNASILFIASERGLYCDEIPYGLMKAALISLTRGMSRRCIKKGIRVNAIAPGITESDMTIVDRNSDMSSAYNCGGRFFLPEEVSEATVFLMSDISKCISGEILACDQGNYLRCDW